MSKEYAMQRFKDKLNRVPREIFKMLYNNEQINEVTQFSVGNRVYGIQGNFYGIIVSDKVLDDNGNKLEGYFIVETDEDCLTVTSDELRHIFEESLPMWAFKNNADNNWIKNDGIEKMSKLGFRIYENESYSYIFGIENYEQESLSKYWESLYNIMGLTLHMNEDIKTVETNGLVTSDLSDFSERESQMVIELLQTYSSILHGNSSNFSDIFGEEFELSGIQILLDKSLGEVFLINNKNQRAMLNEGKLDIYYTTPSGYKGFANEPKDSIAKE